MKKITLIIELIVWTAIIATTIWGISSYINSVENDHVELSLEFSDIDGLDIGAPVNFMGLFVGSIEKFDIVDNKVKVTFSLDNKSIKLPRGSTATVQFTGLVGAKTLEIEPSKVPSKSQQRIISIDPIRISSVTELSANSLEALKDGCISISNMLGGDVVFNTKTNIINVGMASNDAIYYADQTHEVLHDARMTILGSLTDINKSLDTSIDTTDRIINSMQTSNYNEDTIAILKAVKYTIFYFYQNLKETNYKRYIDDFIYAGNSMNKRIDQNSMKFFKRFKLKNIIKSIDSFNKKVIKSGDIIENIYSKIECPYLKAKIVKILKITGILKNKTSIMEKAI